MYAVKLFNFNMTLKNEPFSLFHSWEVAVAQGRDWGKELAKEWGYCYSVIYKGGQPMSVFLHADKGIGNGQTSNFK